MKILFKKIDNEKQFESLWKKIFIINAISGLLLGLILSIPLIEKFFVLINSGFDFFALGSLLNISSPFLSGIVDVVYLILVGLMLLALIDLQKGKRKSGEGDAFYYSILSLNSGIVFIFSFMGLLSFFSLKILSLIISDQLDQFIIFIMIFLLILSAICFFTSILWFIIFRNKYSEYCDKVKKKKIAKEEKLLNIKEKRKTKIERKNENIQFEKLKIKKQKLQELKEMFEEKLITEEDYEKLRKNIIERKKIETNNNN